MTDPAGLVDYAEQVLDGKVALGSSAPRTAALLARCALEQWLDERSASWSSGGYPYPSTVSKLIALGALEGDELATRARLLWSSLSRAVHRHAYELQPSVAEVRHLVKKVPLLWR